jgi:hypothetical protein
MSSVVESFPVEPFGVESLDLDGFSLNDLKDLRPGTRREFARLADRLPFSGEKRRGCEVFFPDGGAETRTGLYVTAAVEYDEAGAFSDAELSVQYYVADPEEPDDDFDSTYISHVTVEDDDPEKIAEMAARIEKLCAEAPEDEATWVRAVWENLKMGDSPLIDYAAVDLLARSPYPQEVSVLQAVDVSSSDGSLVQGTRLLANRAYLERTVKTLPEASIRSVRATTPQGKYYDYWLTAGGAEHLLVCDLFQNMSLDPNQAPEDLFELREQAEAAGLTTPTEGKMRAFMTVLQAVLAADLVLLG